MDHQLATRRRSIRADTIEEAIDLVYAAYREIVPQDLKKKVAKPDVPLEPVSMPETGFKIVKRSDRNRSQRGPEAVLAEAAEEDEPSIDEVEAADKAEIDSLEALRAEAEALGVEVDRRWGERRLREVIEAKRA